MPQYKNLSLENILEFASDKPGISDYLPDDIDLPRVPKQWIVNVCAVVIGEQFKQWVYHQVQKRNVLMNTKKEMMITMDPDMAAKFGASTHMSRKFSLDILYFMILFFPAVSKGISANLLKDSSKRRRTLKQIKADKDAEAQKQADIEAKLAMVDQLQQQVLALQ